MNWEAKAALVNKVVANFAIGELVEQAEATQSEKLEWCIALRNHCAALLAHIGESVDKKTRDSMAVWDARLLLAESWDPYWGEAPSEWTRALSLTLFDALPTSRENGELVWDFSKYMNGEESIADQFRTMLDLLVPGLRALYLVAGRAGEITKTQISRGGKRTDIGRALLFQELVRIYTGIYGQSASGLTTIDKGLRDALPAGPIFDWHRTLLMFIGRRAKALTDRSDAAKPLIDLADWAAGNRKGYVVGARDGLAWRIREARRSEIAFDPYRDME